MFCVPRSGELNNPCPWWAVREAQRLSCPQPGHALPVITRTFSGGLCPGLLWPPAQVCWALSVLRQKDSGLGGEGIRPLSSEFVTVLRSPL